MSIIHSSSLTYTPLAYNQPRFGRMEVGASVPATVDDTLNTGLNAHTSSTQQIHTALSNAGLLNADSQNHSNNSRTQKALNAYTQNLNLSAKQHVADTISGIDTYA